MTLEPLLWLHWSIPGRCLLEYIIGAQAVGNWAGSAPGIDGMIYSGLLGSERVPREQKMLKGHLPRVIYHQAY